MLKYDFHCHSNASDGVLSPTELVLRAVEMGVQWLALTDHDTLQGLEEAAFEAKNQNIIFVNGVEISTCWANKDIHIVGLDFDPQNITLNNENF